MSLYYEVDVTFLNSLFFLYDAYFRYRCLLHVFVCTANTKTICKGKHVGE